MSNKQQTAVEWLFDQMFDPTYPAGEQIEWLEKAKEIEKEQHANTWGNALSAITVDKWESFEQYYNETYGGNK